VNDDLVPLQLMHASRPGLWIASATITVLLTMSLAGPLAALGKAIAEGILRGVFLLIPAAVGLGIDLGYACAAVTLFLVACLVLMIVSLICLSWNRDD
jgi:mannose/fructose/N-acetylgalactosamine-specific phosphotransferase system component IID